MKKILLLLIFITCSFSQILFAQNTIIEKDDWYFRTEDKTSDIYVYEIGKGIPYVVLHGGFGAEHSYLLDALKGLESKYHFIFYDQRGSLRSPAKPENISVENHIDDLETLRKALGYEKINILGHSNGSRLAMLYLRKYPERVKNLVFVGAVYPRGGEKLNKKEKSLLEENHKSLTLFTQRPEVREEFAKYGMEGVEKPPSKRTPEENESIPKAFSKLSPKERAHLDKISTAAPNIYDIRRWNLMNISRPFYKYEAGNVAYKSLEKNYDFVPDLSKHSYPITVINGDKDFVIGSNRWNYIAPQIKNLDFKVLKNAGHNLWIDYPQKFKETLDKALAR